ncbi:hypothetical protein H845_2785 [Komagataeibacter xylinus E25]|nr:hypothetical protein H845_45 [Komagataeibacter xylinus E25]AHI24647.1 hypothetical protein H845_689 [Komagataeibacter xylinus E25]AHI24874.1 hypothetical protein H845_923 [Komagataeibacter xylinus E25]AHI26395.1 hypothetical protein H845_2471 [Komagataeibacter xylinus E25]AHI26696.1 hypothetical protein H845_2785 [Komagataeibacter xylinus E25]
MLAARLLLFGAMIGGLDWVRLVLGSFAYLFRNMR